MYVYRFINKDDEIIYIGRADNIQQRMSNHNHLPKECYDETVKREYIILNNNDESAIYERYLINKFTPKYNQQYNNGSKFGFELPELEWTDLIKYNKIKVLDDVKNSTYTKNLYNSFRKYKSNFVFNIIFNLKNKSKVYNYEFESKEMPLKIDKYNFLYNKQYKFNLQNSENCIFGFLEDENKILIYFNQWVFIEVELLDEDVYSIMNWLDESFEYKKLMLNYYIEDEIMYFNCIKWLALVNCWISDL